MMEANECSMQPTASWVIVHSVRVEGECLVGSIDSNRDGTMFGDGDFQSFYTAWSNVNITRDLGCHRYVIYMAIPILKKLIFSKCFVLCMLDAVLAHSNNIVIDLLFKMIYLS